MSEIEIAFNDFKEGFNKNKDASNNQINKNQLLLILKDLSINPSSEQMYKLLKYYKIEKQEFIDLKTFLEGMFELFIFQDP